MLYALLFLQNGGVNMMLVEFYLHNTKWSLYVHSKPSKISKSYFPFSYLNALTYWNVTVEEYQLLISVIQIRICFKKHRFFSSMLENGDDYIQVEKH
jgi:hypothetical protein